MAIIGIDLGTTNSLAACWRNGRAELIPNALGEFLTPSVVSLDQDGSVLVGKAARERLISCPERTAACFKREMGTARRYDLGGRTFTPEELSSFVLRQLRADAEAFLGEAVTEAVVSVPAYFAEAQRSATKRAGALAGLTVERLVNEPSAAAVAAHIGDGDADKVCLVFDFGGGTLDVSLVERFENVISVTAVSGDNRLGGRDFDMAIVLGFCQDCGLDFASLSRQQRELLLRQAESCKVALTTQKSVLMLYAGGEDGTVSAELTNEWLIRKSAALFKRLTAPVRRVLLDSGTPPGAVDELVMVGGSSRMPSVRGYVAQALGKDPASGAQPDTAIALGAGICAGMKARAEGLRELVLTDVCPFTLGIDVQNHADYSQPLMSPIIERNSVLPSSKVQTYCTSRDNQTLLTVNVYQGENRYAKDNTLLGSVQIRVPAAPQGEQTIGVRFTYDINGILEVDVAAKAGQTAHLLLKSGDISQTEAQRRMRELAALKLHPRDQEQNRALIARGERLYAITVGELRTQVAAALDWFQKQVASQEALQIARAARRTAAYFDQVEAFTGEVELPGGLEEEWGDL